MSSVKELEYQEIQLLVQMLKQHLMTLSDSLGERLTPTEREALSGLFQVQTELHKVMREISPKTEAVRLPNIAPLADEQQPHAAAEQNTDSSIAYAQAIQYARDLVQAIRQKKEHQRRLELTSQQLIRAEKLATVGHVAAAVAHELGNIFPPLLMYAKLIYNETVDNPHSEVAEFADQITRIANRASDMLRQLVDAARTERGMMIPINLAEIIQNVLALLAPQIRARKIVVGQDYPETIPLVMGRPDQLEQVFINIGLNAFDAMPEGGKFTITINGGQAQEERLSGVDFITIRFSDTGMGVPPENIGFLFEPFYTTKERGAGTGLGLFVSHLIIDQHGGAIEVESKQGKGTTFIVKLPVADKEKGTNGAD